MKFLIDAQLPRRFCAWLVAAGHDATHTLIVAYRHREHRQCPIGKTDSRQLGHDYRGIRGIPVYRARERNAGDSRMIGYLQEAEEGEVGVANNSGNHSLSLKRFIN